MKAAFDSSGEVLVVTGGAQGIGAAIARAFAEAGGSCVVLDIAEPEAELARTPRVQVMRCDVADRDALCSCIDAAIRDHGRIDGLVAAAAVQPRLRLADTDPDDWQRVIDVNLNGAVWACQAVLPAMTAARRGSIVLFGSGLGTNGRAEAAAYAATKAAMVALAKSLAAETAADGVRVNVLFPGVIDTEQFRRANPGAEREFWQRTTGIGQPADVVGPLLFLLSDAATMTGSVLSRDRAFGQTT